MAHRVRKRDPAKEPVRPSTLRELEHMAAQVRSSVGRPFTIDQARYDYLAAAGMDMRDCAVGSPPERVRIRVRV